MKISIYELIGLIKDDKTPKKIKIDNDVWYLYKNSKGKVLYIDNETSYWDSCTLSFEYYIENNKLNDTVEILPEENDEWENIEEYQYSIIPSYFDLKSAIKTINENFEKHQKALMSIIKNQKILKEKLESKDEN